VSLSGMWYGARWHMCSGEERGFIVRLFAAGETEHTFTVA